MSVAVLSLTMIISMARSWMVRRSPLSSSLRVPPPGRPDLVGQLQPGRWVDDALVDLPV